MIRHTKTITTALAALTLASGAALASAAAASPIHECGNAGTLYNGQVHLTNVTSRNVACRTARRFARTFELHAGEETGFRCAEDFRCTWLGWHCTNDGRGRTYIDHRCVKGARVVRWQTR